MIKGIYLITGLLNYSSVEARLFRRMLIAPPSPRPCLAVCRTPAPRMGVWLEAPPKRKWRARERGTLGTGHGGRAGERNGLPGLRGPPPHTHTHLACCPLQALVTSPVPWVTGHYPRLPHRLTSVCLWGPDPSRPPLWGRQARTHTHTHMRTSKSKVQPQPHLGPASTAFTDEA